VCHEAIAMKTTTRTFSQINEGTTENFVSRPRTTLIEFDTHHNYQYANVAQLVTTL